MLALWLSAAPAGAQPPAQASPPSASRGGEVQGAQSAVIKALRAPVPSALPASEPLSQAAPATAAQQPAPILPPAGSPPLLRTIRLEFPTQGNASVIEPPTYLFYIKTRPSRPSDGVWVPYDESIEKSVLEDFKTLWATNFLDNLWIEVRDAPYANGVMGKEVWFFMEERQRVKIVDYVGSKKIEQSKIEEKLREENVNIRLDSFVDPALIRRVEGIVRGMFQEKGYEFARVTHTFTEVAGGPKLVNLTFNLDEGPKVKVRDIDFVGNKAFSDGKLEGQMKSNKSEWMWSFITGRGTYQAAKFEEDADLILEHYRNEGYVMARVGQPELRYIEDSTDRRTRYVQLRVPVTEGERYRVGDFTFDGNTVIKSEGLQGVFRVKPGSYYSEKKIRKALEKAREVYGSLGYYEFTAYPDIKPRQAASGAEEALSARPPGPPTIDVTMRVQEGKQYFVNRITFVGNTTTRDNVIRREIRLFEGGVFNTEALKYSVKRLNQLGYFKQLEGGSKELTIDKTPGSDNQVDVKLKLEEQNRNQLTFGAGVSQYEGFFGQLTFQTSNFLGRGETLTVALQQGSRARNYQLGFSEPFLFDRPLTLGTELHRQQIRYPYTYTQNNSGGSVTFGFAVRSFSRAFTTYAYDQITIQDLNPAFLGPPTITPENPDFAVPPLGYEQIDAGTGGTGNPFYDDMLLLGSGGKRTVSKITPSFVHNTVDNPIFPSAGRRVTFSVDLAGPGGNTRFVKPFVEGVYYKPLTRRMTVGARGQWVYITSMGDTILPIFERLFLGGEYSVRGFDIRTIGPRDPLTGYVIGGNTSLLFNAEYLIQIAGPVRLVFFYDAGEVLVKGQRPSFEDFKTSTGAEIRFFMPVLNVPFRLIAAWNPQREGVYDNQLQPQKAFTFRFAVGSTF
jgi:outer membrane protein insertion porin family